jgi:transposase InsO family protein
MVESISLMSLRTSVQQKELNGNLTAPHNPQQNGVAERKNRTIVGQLGRCCMIKAYHFTCGLRHATQRFIFRTEVLIRYLG